MSELHTQHEAPLPTTHSTKTPGAHTTSEHEVNVWSATVVLSNHPPEMQDQDSKPSEGSGAV
jgi:hypothetical protein